MTATVQHRGQRGSVPDHTAVPATRAIGLVARREFIERLKDKSFVISTLFVVVLVGGILLIGRLLGDPSQDVALAGEGSQELGQALQASASAFGGEVTLHPVDGVTEGEALLEAGDADLLVVGRTELVVARDADAQLTAMAQAAAREFGIQEGLSDAGLGDAEIAGLLASEPLPVRSLDPPDPHRDVRAGIAFIGLMLLYGQLFGYGFAVASGVVEEKSSRVVEILLSTVRPSHLLAGKILGIGALGLLQLLLVAGVAIGLVLVTGTVELPPGTGLLVLQLVGWFLLGYTLYSTLFAGIGALTSRIEELQSVMSPFTFVIFGSFFASFLVLNDPTTTLARVVSLLPPSAPMAMPIRIAQEAAAGWEIALAVVLLLAAIAAAIPIGARLYSGGALRTSGTLRYREAWRSTRG